MKLRHLLLLPLFFCTSSQAANPEEHWCQNGSRRIYGELYKPDTHTTGKLPLVILSHGFGGNSAWARPYAERLTHEGYMVYCFDFCGGGNRSRSDGKTTEMSVVTEKADLKAVLTQLRQLPDVDVEHITLWGESQGGIVTALAAAETENLIHDIVLFYPAFSIPDDTHRRYPNRQQIPEQGEIWGMKLGRCYGEDIYDLRPYDAIANFSKPVLIIHGDDDHVVPVGYSDLAAQTYPAVTYYVLNGIDHGFQGNAQWLATELVLQFLRQQRGS